MAPKKPLSKAEAGARTTRGNVQTVSGTGSALVITWVYGKLAHDSMPAEVALVLAAFLTGAANFVMNRTLWGRRLFAPAE